MRYFEDIAVGETVPLDTYDVTEAEIRSFAEQWDPLSIHLDPGAGTFDGLVASGVHTLCIATRLAVEAVRSDLAAVAGLGLDDLRWPTPVRPGDTLTGAVEVTATRRSESAAGTGVVESAVTLWRVGDEATVLTFEDAALVRERPPDGGE